MKTTVTTILALTLTTTSLLAANGKINGNSGSVDDVCDFKDITDGSMTWDEGSLTWTVTTPLTVDLKVRGQTSVTVTNDGTLYTSGGSADGSLDFNYSNTSTSGSFSGGTLTGFDYRDRMDIEIGGSATMSDPEYLISGNTDYYTEHTITCVQ